MNGAPAQARRVAVTGWGLVARALATEVRRRGGEVLVGSRGVEDGPGFVRADLAEARGGEILAERLVSWRPDLVVHTAAMTSVRACQDDVRGAYLANVAGTRRAVSAARAAAAPLAHLSTDWVFPGGRGGYGEEAPLGPRNVYALTKAWSEEPVLQAGGLVLRGTFLGRRPDGREGFVERLLDPAAEAAVASAKRASPLWVGHAAGALLDLAALRVDGVLHIGSREPVAWPELAALIRRHASITDPPAAADPGDDIDRPRDTSLDVGRAERTLGRPMPTVAETVEAMLSAPALTGRAAVPAR